MSIKCVTCGKPAEKKTGGRHYCAVHYRTTHMRTGAVAAKAYFPGHDAIIKMAEKCGMVCVGCGEPMHWLQETSGKRRQVTLQHDRDGTVRLLCLSCNVRHAALPGDMFYSIPAGQKYCPACKEVKPVSAFSPASGRPGLRAPCKPCGSKQSVAYFKAKRNEARP